MQVPIRVRAKPGVLVSDPSQKCVHGGVALYVGRDVDHEAHKRGETNWDALYPPKAEPSEYSMQTHGYTVLSEIQRAVREGMLLVELKAPVMQGDGSSSEPSASRKRV